MEIKTRSPTLTFPVTDVHLAWDRLDGMGDPTPGPGSLDAPSTFSSQPGLPISLLAPSLMGSG